MDKSDVLCSIGVVSLPMAVFLYECGLFVSASVLCVVSAASLLGAIRSEIKKRR